MDQAWLLQRHLLAFQDIPSIQKSVRSEGSLRFLTGGVAPPPQPIERQIEIDRAVYAKKAAEFSAKTGSSAVLQGQLRVELCLVFSAIKLMLIENLASFRPLLPKPLTNHHASHSPAPSPTSLQHPQYFAKIGAMDDGDLAFGRAGPSDTAQGDRTRQVNGANQIMGPRGQKKPKGSAEGPAHPNPKIPINRVQKREKRRARGSKTAVACENCRYVVRFSLYR